MSRRSSSWPPTWSLDALVDHIKLLPWALVGITLMRRAQGAPWSTTELYWALATALALAWTGLAALQNSLAWGTTRSFKWQHEVVVVTGGSRGLGRIIADTYAMRGVSVAVLDVVPYENPTGNEHLENNINWYRTDVGDEAAVLEAKRAIEADLGPVTILINNAGIINGRTMLDIPSPSMLTNFRVNLFSHFYTIRAFLPSMQSRVEGGTIVTVSSVLGELGGCQLSDYAAAKAGLIAMHNSLRSELDAAGRTNIQTLLVKPGQLSTPLFDGVETPNSFLGPVVSPTDLAVEIIQRIDGGRNGVISMPLYADYIEWLSVLPYGLQMLVRRLSGLDRAMTTFVGRPESKG